MRGCGTEPNASSRSKNVTWTVGNTDSVRILHNKLIQTDRLPQPAWNLFNNFIYRKLLFAIYLY